MKLAEKLIASMVLLGIILQLLSIGGGLLLNTIASLLLALFYFFLGIFLFNDVPLNSILNKQAYQGVKWYRLLLAFITSVVFVIMLAGILFRISKWDGGFFLLKIGALLLLPIGVVSLIKVILRPSKYYSAILIRSGIMILAGVTILIFLK